VDRRVEAERVVNRVLVGEQELRVCEAFALAVLIDNHSGPDLADARHDSRAPISRGGREGIAEEPHMRLPHPHI